MIPLTINNFIIYFSIAWGTNISLNFLYVIKRYFPKVISFDKPIDFGLKYKGEYLIGESTTIVGLILCLIFSIILYFSTYFVWAIIPILVYFGHLLGSFIKRRMHKKGGEFVPFIDHGDYMIFVGTVFILLHYITFLFAFWAILITYILHPISCFLAFKFKLRQYPY